MYVAGWAVASAGPRALLRHPKIDEGSIPSLLHTLIFQKGTEAVMAKTYSEKLKDPRWQKLRLEILERDGWRCQCCGDAKSTLHVHHKYYESGFDPWDYDQGTLETLCETCHESMHILDRDLKREIALLDCAQRLDLLRYVTTFRGRLWLDVRANLKSDCLRQEEFIAYLDEALEFWAAALKTYSS